MKGRILDPKLGRFLTTDPIVSNLYDGQSLNSYAYVLNNPLAFVDPSGFQGVPASPVLWMPEGQAEDVVTPGAGFRVAQYLNHEGPAPSTPGKLALDAAKSGAAAPATDVDTLIARLTVDAADRARPACFIGLAASVCLLALTVTVLQLPPPIVTFALASLAFAAALFAPTRVGISHA
jgi:hypothetical protein